jgi:hypothetical protein
MRYLCLIYDDESKWGTMPKTEADAMMGEYFAFTEGIKKSGNHLGGEALQPTQTATTVRVRQGKISSTDGPFAETKEQLLGFWVVECASLDEALETARDLARANPGTGAYEIRPVGYYDAGGAAT